MRSCATWVTLTGSIVISENLQEHVTRAVLLLLRSSPFVPARSYAWRPKVECKVGNSSFTFSFLHATKRSTQQRNATAWKGAYVVEIAWKTPKATNNSSETNFVNNCFVCKVCDAAFSRLKKRILTSHRKRVHRLNEDRTKARIAEGGKLKKALSMRSPRDEKPLDCIDCAMSSSRSPKEPQIARICPSVTTYPILMCLMCGSGFSRKLVIHWRKHTTNGELPARRIFLRLTMLELFFSPLRTIWLFISDAQRGNSVHSRMLRAVLGS